MSHICKSTLAVVFSALLGSTALAQDADRRDMKTPPGQLKKIHAAMGEVIGISADQVPAYQARVAEANALDERLKSELAGQYGGMRIMPGKNFKAQFYIKDDAKTTLARFTDDKDFMAKPVQYSLEELKAIQNNVSRALADAGVEGNTVLSVEKQNVVVYSTDVKAARKAVKGEPGRVLRFEQEDRRIKPTAYIDGGLPNNLTCTTGLSVRSTSNPAKRGITTAGHCDGDQTGSAAGSTMVVNGNSIPYVAELYNESPNPRDLQWHSNSTDTFGPFVDDRNGSFFVVDYTSTPTVGQTICIVGRISNIRCGIVDDQFIDNNDNSGINFFNAFSWTSNGSDTIGAGNTVVVQSGDSGSPIISSMPDGIHAHGFEFAGNFPTTKGGSAFRRGFGVKYYDIGKLGAEVVTSYNNR